VLLRDPRSRRESTPRWIRLRPGRSPEALLLTPVAKHGTGAQPRLANQRRAGIAQEGLSVVVSGSPRFTGVATLAVAGSASGYEGRPRPRQPAAQAEQPQPAVEVGPAARNGPWTRASRSPVVSWTALTEASRAAGAAGSWESPAPGNRRAAQGRGVSSVRDTGDRVPIPGRQRATRRAPSGLRTSEGRPGTKHDHLGVGRDGQQVTGRGPSVVEALASSDSVAGAKEWSGRRDLDDGPRWRPGPVWVVAGERHRAPTPSSSHQHYSNAAFDQGSVT